MIDIRVPFGTARYEAPRNGRLCRAVCALLAILLSLAPLVASAALAQSTVASQSSALSTWSEPVDRAQKWISLPEREQEKIALDKWEALQVDLSFSRQFALEEAADGNLESRILQAQLAELGPVPTADKPEDAWVAERRDQINLQLAKVQAPIVALHDLHARAGVLSREVAQIVKRRQRIELLTGSASPLLPGFWVDASRDTATLFRGIETSVIRAPESIRWVLAGLIALVLLAAWFGHRWILRWIGWAEGHFASARLELAGAFVRDMLGLLSPLVFFGALLAIVEALAPDLAGLGALATPALGAVLAFVVFRWLGHSLFMPSFKPARIFLMPAKYERRALRASYLLAIVMAAESLASSFHDSRAELAGLDAAFAFVIVLAVAYAAWRLLAIVHIGLVAHVRSHPEKSDKLRQVILRPIAQVARTALIIAVVAGAFGFVRLSYYVVTSTISSLAIVFGAVFIFKSVTEAATTLFRRNDGTRPTAIQMLPILFGFSLAILAIPLIALSWGFTVGNIVDFVLALRNGMAIGEVRISFGGVFRFALVFVCGYALTRWLQQALQYIVLQRMVIDRGAQAAILTGVGYTGLAL
ncbi:MAG: hypothetical protein KDE63_10635, partial [Novosphingobium sp.]|nr:hypothetical protein [Novosphingobium sp.]